MTLDSLDEKILKNLAVDARQSARQLALKLGVSTVTILSRMKRLEMDKIIVGYTATIDHEKIGYSLTAIIEIIAKNDKIEDIEKEMKRLQNAGIRTLNDKPKKGADNKLICFLHPKDTNGVLIELCQEIK